MSAQNQKASGIIGALAGMVGLSALAGVLVTVMVTPALAVTGIAGPGGGSADKPVGTVWFGFALDGDCSSECQVFAGDRAAVRTATLQHALSRLLELLQASSSKPLPGR